VSDKVIEVIGPEIVQQGVCHINHVAVTRLGPSTFLIEIDSTAKYYFVDIVPNGDVCPGYGHTGWNIVLRQSRQTILNTYESNNPESVIRLWTTRRGATLDAVYSSKYAAAVLLTHPDAHGKPYRLVEHKPLLEQVADLGRTL
jgi:hypothetical protein